MEVINAMILSAHSIILWPILVYRKKPSNHQAALVYMCPNMMRRAECGLDVCRECTKHTHTHTRCVEHYMRDDDDVWLARMTAQ